MRAAWFFRQLSSLFVAFCPFVVVAWIDGLRRRDGKVGLVTAWLAIAVLTVVVQRKYFGYHFFVIAAPVALLAASGLVRLSSGARPNSCPPIKAPV